MCGKIKKDIFRYTRSQRFYFPHLVLFLKPYQWGTVHTPHIAHGCVRSFDKYVHNPRHRNLNRITVLYWSKDSWFLLHLEQVTLFSLVKHKLEDVACISCDCLETQESHCTVRGAQQDVGMRAADEIGSSAILSPIATQSRADTHIALTLIIQTSYFKI